VVILMGMEKINFSKTTFLVLFLAVGFFVGVSFTSVYAGIPWGTSEIADNAITTEKIKQRQVKTGDIKNNAVKSNKIRDGTIQGVDIASNTVGGSEIAGTSKLIFGTCSELIPFEIPSSAGFGFSLICDESNVMTSDQVVGTYRGANSCPLHVRTLIIQNGEISFDFKNRCDATFPPNTITLTVDYIVFKT